MRVGNGFTQDQESIQGLLTSPHSPPVGGSWEELSLPPSYIITLHFKENGDVSLLFPCDSWLITNGVVVPVVSNR